MGYLLYYVLPFAAAYAVQNPLIALAAVVIFAARGWLPDPVVWLRTYSHARALRQQVKANPANAVARRDLARILIAHRRPKSALPLLDEALRRAPDDPALLVLAGEAHLAAGDPESALAPLVRAVELAPSILYGEPYRIAGRALARLRRFEEAEDAFERFLRFQGSSIAGHVELALVRRRRGDAAAARASLAEGIDTFSQVPWFKKREQLGWLVAAHVVRIFT
jgi:tetratricopeptide (TPR) repeat protein